MTTDARALYRRGTALVNEGRYLDARRVLGRAAAVAAEQGEIDLVARIAGTTGYLLAISSDADEGERLCREALARSGITSETIAILHGQLGSIEMSRGRLDSAADWLSKSIRGLAHDPVRAANMRMNRSLVNMDRGHLAAAKSDLELAEKAYLDADMPLDAAQAVHNSAYVSMLEGDLVTAVQTMQKVRAPLDAESEFWAATNELDRAQALRDAGLVTEAETSLANVARVFGRFRGVREQAEAEYQLARSLLSHAPARAAVAAAAAARRFRRVGSDAWAWRAEAVRLRARLAVGANDQRVGTADSPARLPSTTAVETAALALEAHGSWSDAAALRLADRLARLRRTGRGSLPDGVRRVPRNAPLEVAILAHELRAEHARLAGREADVRRAAARGVELIERSQHTMGSLDLQGAAVMQGRGLLTAGLSSAIRSGRPDVIFDWSERARHVSQRIVPLRPPPDAELAASLAELRMIRAADPSGDWLGDPRAGRLRDRARERQWSNTGAALVRDRARLADARSALEDGDALISFVYDGQSLVALGVTHRGAQPVSIDWGRVRSALAGLRSDLDVTASVRSGPLADVVRRALDDRLAALSSLLLDSVLQASGQPRRVVLTVPGILTGVPWNMLPAMRGRVVTETPSASRWVRERGDAPWRTRAVGFAVGPGVARGDEEVARSAAAWATERVLRGPEATVDAFTELAADLDIAHISAHGRHAIDNPQFSALELADGALFGYDIDRMPRVPQTVILSACEVGRSSVRWGEEAIGMTRVWLHAGARCVIAAPVVVADDVACELLGAMHEALAAGHAPAEALAAASARTGIVAPFQSHGAGF